MILFKICRQSVFHITGLDKDVAVGLKKHSDLIKMIDSRNSYLIWHPGHFSFYWQEPVFYRPHPKDGEGNVFSLSTSGRGGGSVQLGGGGVRSVQAGGGGQSVGGGGGSASCALLRAVCLLRSRRRTFLFENWLWYFQNYFKRPPKFHSGLLSLCYYAWKWPPRSWPFEEWILWTIWKTLLKFS